MDTAIFLSGTTRGGALEGIGRAFAPVLKQLGIDFVEASLLDLNNLVQLLRSIDLKRVQFVLSCVGMGMDITLPREGKDRNLWEELGIPFMTLHGDSPAYFFDRHVVRNSSVVSLYAFAEHLELRKRLPQINGPVGILPPILLDEICLNEMDVATKKQGTLIFLKNGKDPLQLKRLWARCLDARMLRAICEIADELERDLDAPAGNQIDSVVTRYFEENCLNMGPLVKTRLLFIAQLDDYLRAVKCTRMAIALMDLPIEIRGNNWDHLDFSGKRARCIDDCNYVDSTHLIRSSLGTIDMSPNTISMPHDRVMRAYGAKTLCLTNAHQGFTKQLPYQTELTYSFEKESLQSSVAGLLANKGAAIDMGIEVAAAFKQLNPPERSFELMLTYSAGVKLDRLPQRPEGLQDFFVWPPQAFAGAAC